MPNEQPARSNLPTLEDVAARAGVSTATVSRSLNAAEQVSRATRERVMAAVRELGYAPNFGAQALAGKRTNTFGAIIPTMENAIFARGLQAFQEQLSDEGITLLVASSSYSAGLEEQQIRTLVARGADAMLLIGHDRTPETYAFLERRKIPYVVAWVYDSAEPRLSIGFDNRKAMAALTRRVLDLGHVSIAVITAECSENDRARERLAGVKDVMRERDFDPGSLRIIETTYSIGNGAEAFSELMQGGKKPTAVLCGNDVLAAGALMTARKLRIRVPEDVSITGFDDIELAQIVSPALTTVHVPHREMGRGAARLLMALRNGEDPGESIELEASLRWRETLGPAASNSN